MIGDVEINVDSTEKDQIRETFSDNVENNEMMKRGRKNIKKSHGSIVIQDGAISNAKCLLKMGTELTEK